MRYYRSGVSGLIYVATYCGLGQIRALQADSGEEGRGAGSERP